MRVCDATRRRPNPGNLLHANPSSLSRCVPRPTRRNNQSAQITPRAACCMQCSNCRRASLTRFHGTPRTSSFVDLAQQNAHNAFARILSNAHIMVRHRKQHKRMHDDRVKGALCVRRCCVARWRLRLRLSRLRFRSHDELARTKSYEALAAASRPTQGPTVQLGASLKMRVDAKPRIRG